MFDYSYAILYKLDEDTKMLSVEHIKPKEKTFTIEEMQKAIKGYVEQIMVMAKDNTFYYIFADEDAKLKQKSLNEAFYWNYGIQLFGNILLIPKNLIK